MYRPGTRGYGHEDRYGIRDDDRNGYRRERERENMAIRMMTETVEVVIHTVAMKTVMVEILMVVTMMMIIIEEEDEVMKTFSLAREVGVLIDTWYVVMMTMVVIHQGIWSQVEKYYYGDIVAAAKSTYDLQRKLVKQAESRDTYSDIFQCLGQLTQTRLPIHL
ncbi:uncharacterized protein LOC113335245 [Papaver somniferum]|uniref:uncharacterized protein LOC113335245 n=1 Tax=Papaver somniferum TaxID=3469 RepID=UPI000E6F756C|nr:uncharacterized protein LOC113335245 [Papaver somniferum]